MAIPIADRTKRDANKTADAYADGKKGTPLFAQILDTAMDEQTTEQKTAPGECHTVTYGQDCMLRTFQYQKREYHY